jgi:hypothetical protein
MSNISYNLTLTPANVATFGLTSIAPNLPKVFPNGNSNVSASVAKYVDRYNAQLCKSADAIISLGETLVEAKEKLNKEEFKTFLEQTALNKNKSTYSKLIKIGENAPRLRPYVNNLPQNWTTIYALSKLEADQFEKVVPNLSAYSTAKDIAYLTEAKLEQKEHFSADLTISLINLDLDTKQKIVTAIEDLKTQHKFKLKISSQLDAELNPEPAKVAA